MKIWSVSYLYVWYIYYVHITEAVGAVFQIRIK